MNILYTKYIARIRYSLGCIAFYVSYKNAKISRKNVYLSIGTTNPAHKILLSHFYELLTSDFLSLVYEKNFLDEIYSDKVLLI